jgi:hypothetical protein
LEDRKKREDGKIGKNITVTKIKIEFYWFFVYHLYYEYNEKSNA